LVVGDIMIGDMSILVLIHFVSDFFFQPGSWAKDKIHHFKPLLYHSIQYTIPFLIAFYFMDISLLWGLLIFASHFIIDNRQILNWWNRVRGEKNCPEWIILVQDQALHLVIIIAIWLLQ
jgi:hypothetical protein